MKYYIKENYYFDIDHLNQLRITGPENHLLLGLGFPRDAEIEINEYVIEDRQLVIKLQFSVQQLLFTTPLVTDIRTLRNFTEPIIPRPTYEQLALKEVKEVLPDIIEREESDKSVIFRFYNQYVDINQQLKQYGSELHIPKTTSITQDGQYFRLRSDSPLELMIKTCSNIFIDDSLIRQVFKDDIDLPTQYFNSFLLDLYAQCKLHVEHLIKSRKTSSFEYGTIFPRDWIESADLGKKVFSQDTIDYMYDQSMSYVSEEGEGWHEDIVGQYKVKIEDLQQHIDRKMIDIEPRYIMGVPRVSKQFLTNQLNHDKLKLIARYVQKQAEEQELISFKKVSPEVDEYHYAGNWRDSYMAFPRQKSPLSPYDVNCIFYPVSLKIIWEYCDYFDVEDLNQLRHLINKWEHQKDKFRLYHPEDIIGYSLAIHGKKNRPLPTAHLDESYDLFYGTPNLEEISSFARKVVDDEYFYTPVGPLLVDRDDEELTSKNYHGKVIWPKQAAFAVAGLTRQYFKGLQEDWPQPLLHSVRDAAIKTAEACFKGWSDLNAVPELYFYDEKTDKARLYTEQTDTEGQMSIIQLWSAVGAIRIMQDYASIRAHS